LLMTDGHVKHVHIVGHPAFDEAGNLVEFVGTVMDVTERCQADQERQAIAHVNRITTMGQLTASIAHEVNQPLAAAVTHAHAALRWLEAQPPSLEDTRRSLAAIIKDGNRAGEIIHRIRGLIKRAPSRSDQLDINEPILEVIALARSDVQRSGVSLQTRLAPDLPLVEGDRVQLQQVMLNLILNAVEALSEVSEGSRDLLISSEDGGADGVRVAVQDSGPGLTPGSVDRLFEAFYTTKPTGTGMGLAICRSIIEAHGGRLWATANEPQGAVFQFSLPPKRDKTAPAKRAGQMVVV
jgi:signal transduction histidine kinase